MTFTIHRSSFSSKLHHDDKIVVSIKISRINIVSSKMWGNIWSLMALATISTVYFFILKFLIRGNVIRGFKYNYSDIINPNPNDRKMEDFSRLSFLLS